MSNETTALSVYSDENGYQYSLANLPPKDAPMIQEAEEEILQEMQVDSIIQNLENVARLMFIAYNALGGTTVQPQMSRLQKDYLNLMDQSGSTITTFRHKSEEICVLVLKAYNWLLKGKEGLAVKQFNKCAAAAEKMAQTAENLAAGFFELSEGAELALETAQKEQSLQYKEMDEQDKKLDEYEAGLRRCESLRDSLNEDVRFINQVYQDAKKKEREAFDMKKGVMITQIVTSCIGALIPSSDSLKQGGDGQVSEAQAQSSLEENEKKKTELDAQKEKAQNEASELESQKSGIEKEIADIQQKIEIENSVTARDEKEKADILGKHNAELQKKQNELKGVNERLAQTDSKLKNTEAILSQVAESINSLNRQLAAFADQARDDLQRAEDAMKDALEKKLDLEKQRRDNLASIQEFSAMIQSSVRLHKVAETAVQTLQVAIKCIKQVVVALTTAAKFWRSMEEYCKTLSDEGLGGEIKDLSDDMDMDERLKYYQDPMFTKEFLVYICRWAALYYVCEDYGRRNGKVREMVADNIMSSGSREMEWALAAELAGQMDASIRRQVESAHEVIGRLER